MNTKNKISQDICVICGLKISPPNYLVAYHIRYKPTPLVILACKYCNWTEYCLRNEEKGGKEVLRRFRQVIRYQSKFGIIM